MNRFISEPSMIFCTGSEEMAEGGLPKASILSPRKALIRLIAVAVVVGVAASLVTAMMVSPSISPIASVHDADRDGKADSRDEFPDDPTEWTDSDNDGIGDNSDAFPSDPEEWSDADGDGYGDNCDDYPDDSNEWSDSDGDGVGDNCDEFPSDPDESTDSDGDEIGDNSDDFPDDPSEWIDTDGDGYGDNCDYYPDDYYLTTPGAALLIVDKEIDYVEFSFANATDNLPWEVVTICLFDEDHFATWGFDGGALTGDSVTVWDLGTRRLGDTLVVAGVVDQAGDGVISTDDRLMFAATDGSFRYSVEYCVKAIYSPTGCYYAMSDFGFGDYSTPVAALSKSMITDGLRITVVAITEAVEWSDLTIVLTDGDYAASWSPSSLDLNDGVAVIHDYGVRELGPLIVTLSICDLAGNGYLNGGDFFSLVSTEGTSFGAGTEYTVNIVHEPTDALVAIMSFTG
jgi:hypothetical protein